MVRGLVAELRNGFPNTRSLLRRLQPYMVSVYHGQVYGLKRSGLISEIGPGLYEWLGEYHPVRGIGGMTSLEPDALVV